MVMEKSLVQSSNQREGRLAESLERGRMGAGQCRTTKPWLSAVVLGECKASPALAIAFRGDAEVAALEWPRRFVGIERLDYLSVNGVSTHSLFCRLLVRFSPLPSSQSSSSSSSSSSPSLFSFSSRSSSSFPLRDANRSARPRPRTHYRPADTTPAHRLRLQGQAGDQRQPRPRHLGPCHPLARQLWRRQVQVHEQPPRPCLWCFVPRRECDVSHLHTITNSDYNSAFVSLALALALAPALLSFPCHPKSSGRSLHPHTVPNPNLTFNPAILSHSHFFTAFKTQRVASIPCLCVRVNPAGGIYTSPSRHLVSPSSPADPADALPLDHLESRRGSWGDSRGVIYRELLRL
jgi:hypothetical protein